MKLFEEIRERAESESTFVCVLIGVSLLDKGDQDKIMIFILQIIE